MSRPLISIITINRNNDIGLEKTLAGFREWRLREVEFIFVDGASTDNSLSTAQTFYKENEIRSEPDRGIYHAMNKGIMRARGEYLLFLNSGDHLQSKCAEKVLSALRHSAADIHTFGTQIIWTSSNNEIEDFNPGPEALPHYTLPHQSTFFRREIVLRFDGYNEDFRVAADRDLILRLYHAGATIKHHLFSIAVYYSGGISSSSATAYEDIWIDVRDGRRSIIKLLLGWIRHPPDPAVSRFFVLGLQHLLRRLWPHRRLASA